MAASSGAGAAAASSSSMLAIASQPDIPQASELASLAKGLQDRRRALVRRRRNAEVDQKDVLAGHVGPSDIARTPLSQLLDQSADAGERPHRAGTSISARASPTASPSSRARPLPASGASKAHGKARSGTLATSPPPLHATDAGAGSPPQGSDTLGGSSAPARTKIKVKREPGRERETSVASVSGSYAAGVHGAVSEVASPSVDADWDEEGRPSRPGRSYKRKRHRTASAMDHDSQDDMSLSEAESPAASASRLVSQSAGAGRGGGQVPAPGNTSAASHIKLKLNPTAQTALSRHDTIGNAMLRRPSGIRGDIMPLTPFQAQLAAQWELPKRTPETVVPKKVPIRQHRSYPLKPDDVDVDYAAMDWRERDRERDRLESAGSASGLGAGHALVKETASTSRARDRKQDQVPHHIFQQWSEGWFRTLTEEDLAWLSSKSTDVEPFQTPALGRHYTEVWEEEEAQGAPMPTVYLPGANSVVPTFSGARAHPVTNGSVKHEGSPGDVQSHKASLFDPRKLRDDNLITAAADDARAGPLTERLLSAILPTPPPPQESTASSGPQPNGSGALVLANGHGSGSVGASQDLSTFEERLANELKAIEVLGKEDKIDWSERTDDEVSVALRTVQGLLREQMRANEQRKAVLFQIAMERMAYQEYLGCLASVEREIESGWLKRQAQIKKSMQAQKKRKGGHSSGGGGGGGGGSAVAAVAAAAAAINGAASPAAGTPGGTSMTAQGSSQGGVSTPVGGAGGHGGSSSSGGPIRPQFSEALVAAMQRRLQLKYALEPLFADKPHAKFTPTESIYKSLDDEDADDTEGEGDGGSDAGDSKEIKYEGQAEDVANTHRPTNTTQLPAPAST